MAAMKLFEEIDHTADRAFRITGRDMASLQENSARSMRALDGPRPAGKPSAKRQIELQGVDREFLLVNWLNEILYLEQVHQLVCEGSTWMRLRVTDCAREWRRGNARGAKRTSRP